MITEKDIKVGKRFKTIFTQNSIFTITSVDLEKYTVNKYKDLSFSLCNVKYNFNEGGYYFISTSYFHPIYHRLVKIFRNI